VEDADDNEVVVVVVSLSEWAWVWASERTNELDRSTMMMMKD